MLLPSIVLLAASAPAVAAAAALNASASPALTNALDVSYYAHVLLGNQSFKVLVDTGSSDFWVAGHVKNSTDTGLTSGVTYAADSVQGVVKTANLQFAGHSVPDQAFLEISPDDKYQAGHGIIGLGPSVGSMIAKLLPQGGAPVLDRIFAQNRTTANYFTLLMGRTKDPTDHFNGSITVGDVLPEYRAILDEPKLPITKVPTNQSDDQHLQLLLDVDGLIAPDGNPISFTSLVAQTQNKKQATVVLDCGFTLPQLSRSVVDAIYSRFRGAEFIQIPGIGGAYILPCEQEVNITFKFSGKSFHIHPLDMSMETSTLGLNDKTTRDGEKACVGTFQPFTYERGPNPSYDMVLGMAFMRNVYSLFDYGDFSPNSPDLAPPYIQLLSITEQAEAHQDFVAVRLGGNDTTASRGLVEPKSSSSGSYMYYYIVAAIAVVAFLILVAVFCIVRSRRRRTRR